MTRARVHTTYPSHSNLTAIQTRLRSTVLAHLLYFTKSVISSQPAKSDRPCDLSPIEPCQGGRYTREDGSPGPLHLSSTMFFWCCGPRQEKSKDLERQSGPVRSFSRSRHHIDNQELLLIQFSSSSFHLSGASRTNHPRKRTGCLEVTLQSSTRRVFLVIVSAITHFRVSCHGARYTEDGVDNPSNDETDFLRDILREAEGYVPISRYRQCLCL